MTQASLQIPVQGLSKRILVATNLFGRGMDIESEHGDHYDMPADSDTFSTEKHMADSEPKRLAVTLSDETDAKVLNDVQDRFEVNITELPDEIDLSSSTLGR